jgi:hypothetical protein
MVCVSVCVCVCVQEHNSLSPVVCVCAERQLFEIFFQTILLGCACVQEENAFETRIEDTSFRVFSPSLCEFFNSVCVCRTTTL